MNKRLQRLEKRKRQIDAQVQKTKARQIRNLSKIDTRRKILVGAFFLQKYSLDGEEDKLVKMLDPFLTRDRDRELFGLPPKPIV